VSSDREKHIKVFPTLTRGKNTVFKVAAIVEAIPMYVEELLLLLTCYVEETS